MAYERIVYTINEHVATITLNRPEKLNAWTRTMAEEVRRAMFSAGADDTVRVIVLAGAGRGFCAGADLTQLSETAGGVDQSQDTDEDPEKAGTRVMGDYRPRNSVKRAILSGPAPISENAFRTSRQSRSRLLQQSTDPS
jgi:enoyl-CoA hydratase/carnithine racemase